MSLFRVTQDGAVEIPYSHETIGSWPTEVQPQSLRAAAAAAAAGQCWSRGQEDGC